MSVEFICPQCGQMVVAEDSYRGQVVQCPSCGKGIVVPHIKPKEQGKQPQCRMRVTADYCKVKDNIISTACPHCGTEYEVEQEEIGFEEECQVCGRIFVVKPARVSRFKEPEQEMVLLRAEPSIAPYFALFLMLAAIMGIPAFCVIGAIPIRIGDKLEVMGVIAGVYVAIVVLILICIGVTSACVEYVVTNKRVIARSGMLTKAEREVRAQDMRDIFLVRSLVQRMTGTGTISIGSQTTGLLGRVIIRDVTEYKQIKQTLEHLTRGQRPSAI